MNQEQIDSVVRTILKIAGTALMAHGLANYAKIVNSPDVFGLIVLLVGIYASHQNHSDVGRVPPPGALVAEPPLGTGTGTPDEGSRPTTTAAPVPKS